MADQPVPSAPLPPVQRLSRAVLLVAAGLVTVTLLAVAFLATPKPADRSPAGARPVTAGEPGFLQRPPATPPAASPEISEQEYLRRIRAAFPHGAPPAGSPGALGSRYPGALGSPYPGAPPASPPFGAAAPGDLGPADLAAPPYPDAFSASLASPATAAPAAAAPAAGWGDPRDARDARDVRDVRREAFQRALRAPLAPPAAAPPLPTASPWPPLPAPESLGVHPPGAALLAGPRAANSPLPVDADNASGNPPSLATERRRVLAAGAPAVLGAEATAAGLTPAATAAGLTPAATAAGATASPAAPTAPPAGRTTVLAAGTVVPALLLTAVNSDLPGPLLAQVSRDVYDLHQRTVVLPRGTRLLGTYGNQVAVGQQRLLVAWNRLQLLDGTLLDLPGLAPLQGADPAGAAGLPARVDNHVLRVFGDAILLSLLSAGADLSQPASANALAAPSAGSVASAALGLQLSDAGTQLLRRDLAIQPTLTLPAGTPLTVFVNADLPLPAPAPPAAAAPFATPAAPARPAPPAPLAAPAASAAPAPGAPAPPLAVPAAPAPAAPLAPTAAPPGGHPLTPQPLPGGHL
jgi:type IV secretory pathway VirB10-like protein